jgi:hypothetical protein
MGWGGDDLEARRCNSATAVSAEAKRALIDASQRFPNLLLEILFVMFQRQFLIGGFAHGSIVFTWGKFSRPHNLGHSPNFVAKPIAKSQQLVAITMHFVFPHRVLSIS